MQVGTTSPACLSCISTEVWRKLSHLLPSSSLLLWHIPPPGVVCSAAGKAGPGTGVAFGRSGFRSLVLPCVSQAVK